jgi:hypothetical protein
MGERFNYMKAHEPLNAVIRACLVQLTERPRGPAAGLDRDSCDLRDSLRYNNHAIIYI